MSSEIKPKDYAAWRKSRLGRITEQIELKVIFDLAGDLRDKRVLDLGSGDGSYSIYAVRAGARVVGLDLSAAMLESAERRASAAGVSMHSCQGSAESLPFRSGSFDIVLAVTSLYFIRDPARAAEEASRVLRPGGSFVVGELGRYSSWALWRKLRAWLGSSRWNQAYFWTLGELRELLQQADLRLVSSRTCVYYPPVSLAALILGKSDRVFSFAGQVGAAFLAVRGDKPVVLRVDY